MDQFEWVVIDTETNGLASPIHVVEIAAQRMVGWQKAGVGFRRLINHGVPISPGASKVHGYSQGYIAQYGQDPFVSYSEMREYVGERPIVSYNLAFDLERALINEWARIQIPKIGSRGFCVLRLARKLLSPSPVENYKLQDLRKHFGLPERRAHSAFGDVETTIDLLSSVLLPMARSRGVQDWRGLRSFAGESLDDIPNEKSEDGITSNLPLFIENEKNIVTISVTTSHKLPGQSQNADSVADTTFVPENSPRADVQGGKGPGSGKDLAYQAPNLRTTEYTGGAPSSSPSASAEKGLRRNQKSHEWREPKIGESDWEINQATFTPWFSPKDIALSIDTDAKTIFEDGLNIFSLSLKNAPNVENIFCRDGFIRQLDLGGAKKLRNIDCQGNILSNIQFYPENRLVKKIIARNNLIKELPNLNERIEKIDFSNNKISGDISIYGLHKLERINLSRNLITEIYINLSKIDSEENYTNPKYLNVSNNRLTSIELSDCLNLLYLNCSNNLISEIYPIWIKDAFYINVEGNRIKEFYVNENNKTLYLFCGYNEIFNLIINNLRNLLFLQCQNNMIRKLDLSRNDFLLSIDCSNNLIESIDFSKCYKIKEINISNNKIREIDIYENPELITLTANNNKIEDIDLSSSYLIERIDISNNNIVELDLSNNSKLSYIDCRNNKIEIIDCRKCAEKITIIADENTNVLLTEKQKKHSKLEFFR
jgi:Leucine-rich repeat (LRR) protein/DNA polymerase III epsilon subunit-like protein